jgi:hypothetical protein
MVLAVYRTMEQSLGFRRNLELSKTFVYAAILHTHTSKLLDIIVVIAAIVSHPDKIKDLG